MKEKIKTILIGILIGVIVLPTITLGGSFISNLIAGKTPAEAIQILAEQIDVLIGRVETVEVKQVEQEEIVSGLQFIIDQQEDLIEELQSSQETHQSQLAKEEACRQMDKAEQDFKTLCGSLPYPGMEKCISHWQEIYEYEKISEYRVYKLKTLNLLEELKSQYLSAEIKCLGKHYPENIISQPAGTGIDYADPEDD